MLTYILFNRSLSQSIFTGHQPFIFKQAERTRIEQVHRLLDDLVRSGPCVYQKFLDVLKKTGYEFLANLILENEETLRREKEHLLSIPIQATNQTQKEIYPASIPWSRNTIAAQSSFVGSKHSNSSSMESFGYSSVIYSGSSGSSLPLSKSEPSSLNPQLRGLVVHKKGKFGCKYCHEIIFITIVFYKDGYHQDFCIAKLS